MKHLILLFLLLTATSGYSQDRRPLKEFRAKFLNQRIVVNGSFTSIPAPFLAEWRFVKEKKGVYEPNYLKEVPTSFIGRAGTIIAVQVSESFGQKQAQTDDTYVQYAEAIVRLDSGELVQTALYSVYLTREPGTEPSDALTLVSVREKHKQEATALAARLGGKSLYLTRLTRIFDMGLTTSGMEPLKAGVGYSEAEINDAPLLAPIPVVGVRYSAERDYTIVVLQLSEGRQALYVLGCIAEVFTAATSLKCAFTSMPTFLTDHEIEAIRKGSVFVGMSESALYMAMGFPKSTNDSAVGLKQLVYLSAYIYVDQNKKVAEIQSHD
jgi:hypothetical protein